MTHDDKANAVQKFLDLKILLDLNKTLPWELSMDVIRSALNQINEPFAQQFIDEYLLKIIVTMTSQSPSKLGLFEKKNVEDSLEIAVLMTVNLLPRKISMLAVVARIFDPNIPFYQGSKIGFSYSPGFPMVRIFMARLFAEQRGFHLVGDVLDSEGHWPGSSAIMHLIKVMEINEVASMVDDALKRRMASAVMRGLLALPDDLMKRENCDIMSELVRCTAVMWNAAVLNSKTVATTGQNMSVFFEFWLELVLKLTSSAALVLRLFGWEQLGDIMVEAKLRRAPADAYILEGAGTADVNGVYRLNPRLVSKDEDASFQYTKMPSHPDEPLLTLFRCTMRNKSKWWFISQADVEKPGTDKDIDYYVHRTASEDDKEPPIRGWTRANAGIPLVGADPVPLLHRRSLTNDNFVKQDSQLDRRLLQWANEKDVLNLAFGASSLHREVISRSGKLLDFLCQYDSLSPEQMHCVWRSAIQSHDVDVVDEIFSQLAAVCPLLSSEMFDDLTALAATVLQQHPQNYHKVVQFLEKFSHENGKLVLGGSLNPSCSAKLLSLVWDTYHSVNFSDLKNGTAVQDLLSLLLRQKDGIEFSFLRILECVEALRQVAGNNSKSDASVLRELHILQFLISYHCDRDTAERLEGRSFSELLIVETLRFISTHHEMSTGDYFSQLSHRMQTLRRYFLVTPTVSLSLARVDSLWQALSHSPQEQEQFFLFLSISQSVHVHNTSTPVCVCSSEVAEDVFRLFICSPTVDWALCGTAALECFSAFFAQLITSRSNETGIMATQMGVLRECGLQTLWRIALNMTTSASAADAVAWLVKAYHDTTEDYLELLRVVFVYLMDLPEGEVAVVDSARLLRLTRCIHILHAAMGKSKGVPSVAHSARSRMGRINVSVRYRRVSTHHNHITQLDSLQSEKGSEGHVQLEVHPSFTVLELKEKLVSSLAVFMRTSHITVELSSRKVSVVKDSTRLFELDVVDGSEISVTYQATSYLNDISFEITDEKFYYRDGDVMTNDAVECTHFGVLLAANVSHFDCLLTLCERFKSQSVLTESIWELLMLLPTQRDLQQETLEQICFLEDEGTGVVHVSKNKEISWNNLLNNLTSVARIAYLLQIVDSFLQPASELLVNMTDDFRDKIVLFREAFIVSGGFSSVLKILVATPSDDTIAHSTALEVSLHIIYFLLYDGKNEVPLSEIFTSMLMNDDDDDDGDENECFANNTVFLPQVTENGNESLFVNSVLMELVEQQSSLVIDKLMHVARHAAANEKSSVVHNALTIITTFIRTPEVALQLTSNPESKSLLTTVLRSGSKTVRDIAAHFAVQIGKSQTVAFGWLLDELRALVVGDFVHCGEVFFALTTLFCSTSPMETDIVLLATILSDKLLSYVDDRDVHMKRCLVYNPDEGSAVLLGYLELLNSVLALYPQVVLTTVLGQQLVAVFLNDFLFTLPTVNGQDRSWLCETPATRKAAFNVLTSFMDISIEGFEAVMAELSNFVGKASPPLRHKWSVQVQHDIRRPDMRFAGLKNQGCTCYMNSLLQQLFMSNSFRETILSTPLRESCRVTLWHRDNETLVGRELMFEQCDGSWRCGQVASFDSTTGEHQVEYRSANGSIEEVCVLDIRSGRYQKETGRTRIVTASGGEPVSERDEDAYRVLEQLQRTFCFMKLSKRRYFDPRPFVDACKTLNMNFNVYHQNDAAEFCDQLLDRIETATKGKHSGKDVWTDALMKEVFGGKWLYQKIPTECDIYSVEKAGCGHFQGSRLESFLKVELMIRGKEKIAESLQELVQGELMDGDNKIHCDVCCEKKDTVRRTCFGALPNTLVLHLKRFDLDFQTFETVKLNNRMEFPISINLLPYTREGIEAEERRLQRDAAGQAADEQSVSQDNVDEEDDVEKRTDRHRTIAFATEEEHDLASPLPLAEDFEYHLQGVLVHAGVAQGGHYYSFVRNDESSVDGSGRWYRFEDEDVTPFDPDQIPAQCYGGSPSSTAHSVSSNAIGMHSLLDEDRTSNALMLFYNKVKRADTVDVGTTTEKLATLKVTESDDDVLIDGMQAFQSEVLQSNLQHLMSCCLVDPDLHGFVRSMVELVTKRARHSSVEALDLRWSLDTFRNDLPLRTVQFTCTFLLDVLMHYRERAAMRTSVQVLKDAFDAHPHTAIWFVNRVLDTNSCSWFHEYMLLCTDTLARASFLQLLLAAVRVIAPKEPDALLVEQDSESQSSVLCCLLVKLLLETIPRAVNYVRTADEVFMLIRDLAATEPAICSLLQSMGCVSYLSFFVLPPSELKHPEIQIIFERQLVMKQNSRHEYGNLLQSVLEALAALLGVPQIRKVNLLQDRTYWESDLISEAREALTIIFEEMSRDGGMDAHDIVRYFERVGGNSSGYGNQKMTNTQVRSMIDRFPTTSDNRLSLEGFLQYHTESASYNPKAVWRDLHAFGFMNDLSRSTLSRGLLEDSIVSGASGPFPLDESVVVEVRSEMELHHTEHCRRSLSRFALYETGMGPSEASTKAIAHRVCLHNLEVSCDLLKQALTRLYEVSRDVQWGGNSVHMDFIRFQLDLDDGLETKRLMALLTMDGVGLAHIALQERNHPSICRANEFNKIAVHDRYINYAQDFVANPLVVNFLRSEAFVNPKVKYLLGHLKFGLPDCWLTENELNAVKSTLVVVEGAGQAEVNGEYSFMTIKNNAGSFERMGTFHDQHVRFTLYKCSLKNGGYQWFISLTPDGLEPGSTQDVDYYYAIAKTQDKLPGSLWSCMSSSQTLGPAPKVECIRMDALVASVAAVVDISESSSDADSSERPGGDEDEEGDANSLVMAVGEDDDFINDFDEE